MTLEQQFREWVARAPGINFGNLDYALKDPESIAYDAFQAFKAGVKVGKAAGKKPDTARR